MNGYHPTPGPNLYAPRLVRVVHGIQKCVRCDKPVLDNVLQAGWGFQSCQRNEKEKGLFHRKCATEWWSLAIPPDAPAGHLAAIMGEDLARSILVKAFPQSAMLEPPELWGFPLNPGEEQAWIQVAVRAKERHTHRRSKLSHLISSFLL